MNSFDERHQAPLYAWEPDIKPNFLVDASERVRHDVVDSSGELLPLEGLLLRREASDTLVVYLHGSLDRAKYELPRFERLDSLQEIPHNMLFLADPTLYLHDALRVTWFIGTATDDVTSRYVEYIRTAVDQLGIKKLLLVGASSGGFGAIAMAPEFPEALAIAFSPQIHVGRFGETWAKIFTAAAFPECGTYAAVEASFASRVDLAELYSSTSTGRVWYVQNDGDESHIERQMIPFKESVDDRVTFIIEHHANAHTPPTVARLRQWIEHGIANFDGDPAGFALK